MNAPSRKRIVLVVVALLIVAALIYGFLPEAIPVQTTSVVRAPLQVTIEEEGETQVRQLYVLMAPVAGFLQRIELEAGDPVEAGQVVARIKGPRAALLDARARAEAQARLNAAEAGLVQAQEQARAADAIATRAAAELQRARTLFDAGTTSRQAFEQATAEAEQAAASADAARAAVSAAKAEVAAARAVLDYGEEPTDDPIALRAPVSGRVLALQRKSAGHVNQGEILMEVGNVQALEVRVDALSQDAMRMSVGTRAVLAEWGGGYTLDAVVRRIDPRGETVVSALGVEEQRVPVLLDFTSPREMWTELGTGYRVLARFILWEGDDVLQVPTGALFRIGDGWGVFVVSNGRAELRRVVAGQRSGLSARILEGLTQGEIVIVHPEAAIRDGTRVKAR